VTECCNNTHKYQLSLTEPHNGIAPQTELNDYYDKLAVNHGSSEVLSTDILYEHPSCRAKSTTRFGDRYAEAKFSKSRVWDKVPDGSTLIFGDARISS